MSNDEERGMRDYREGYIYPMACEHRKGICEGKMFVCHECAVKACDEWYLLGLRDAKLGRNRLEENARAGRPAEKEPER